MKLLRRIFTLFLDLDETLLGPDHRVSPASREAIAELTAAGATVVVCTGRAMEASAPIVVELGLRHLVCVNGACAVEFDRPGGQARPVAEALLPADVAGDLAAFAHSRGVPCYLMAPDGYFVSARTPDVERADAARKYAPPLLEIAGFRRPAYKVMPFGGAHLYDEVRARFGDRAHVIYHPKYLEIAPHGVNKAWGAARMAEHLGVDPEACLACGDALNDIELVRWAGVGVAMGDGPSELLQAADFVTAPHSEDGCRPVLRALLRAHRG